VVATLLRFAVLSELRSYKVTTELQSPTKVVGEVHGS
jgi:hypothetical protein